MSYELWATIYDAARSLGRMPLAGRSHNATTARLRCNDEPHLDAEADGVDLIRGRACMLSELLN